MVLPFTLPSSDSMIFCAIFCLRAEFTRKTRKLARSRPLWEKELAAWRVRHPELGEAWDRYWHEHKGAYQPGHRHRGGAVFSAQGVFDALDRGSPLHEERRLADLELRILTEGRSPALEVTDWHARQVEGMARWRERIGSRAPAAIRGFIRART